MIRSVMLWLLFAGTAWAQGQSPVPPPDLRGIWQATGTAYENLEGTPAQRGQPAAKSIVVDPSNGKIPYRADGRKLADKNSKERATSDPLLFCFQPGLPRAVLLPEPFQIFQNSD